MSMDFLPIYSNGEKVYAGFWKRFCAGVADAFILMPLAFLFIWLEGFDRTIAIVITIPSSVLFWMYHVCFNARLGGTPGKLAVGIRITKPDGSRISWPEAWKRSSVDIVLGLLVLVVEIWALTQVDPELYASLRWVERAHLLQEQSPGWYSSFDVVMQVWVWSEVVVLLCNKRKRAIHDFIAGTVVVMKEFTEDDAAAHADGLQPGDFRG